MVVRSQSSWSKTSCKLRENYLQLQEATRTLWVLRIVSALIYLAQAFNLLTLLFLQGEVSSLQAQSAAPSKHNAEVHGQHAKKVMHSSLQWLTVLVRDNTVCPMYDHLWSGACTHDWCMSLRPVTPHNYQAIWPTHHPVTQHMYQQILHCGRE